MSIAELEKAVTQLSEKDLNRFRKWFDEYFAEIWDKQIERDAASGRLDALLEEVDEEYNAGLSKPL
jgi:DNA-binding SARP family transcriptional activator